MNREEIKKDFSDYILMALRSKVYRQICSKLLEEELILLNMLDKQQFDLLFKKANFKPADFVLDLGSGTGEILKHINFKYNCNCIGVDFAEDAVQFQNESIGNDRLKFQALEIDDIDTLNYKFDKILSIDSLFLVNDLEDVILKMYELLNPNGQILIFHSQYPFLEDDMLVIENQDTHIDTCLKEIGIDYHRTDCLNKEKAYWRKTEELFEMYSSELFKENCGPLYEGKKEEIESTKNMFTATKTTRYFYEIIKL